MLLSEKVELYWNSKIKNHYIELGYEFTKMKDSFYVDPIHLTNGSNAEVTCKCDYCGDIYKTKWYVRVKGINNVKRDCCKKNECQEKKAKDALTALHGVDNPFKLSSVREKAKETNLKRYGCENPFSNKEVKAKIVSSNLKKYGVKYTMQNPVTVEKSKKTCMERYGVTNYGKIYSESHVKEKSPTWKGGVEYHNSERATYEYRSWRKKVLERDKNTCQICHKNHTETTIVAHHLNSWSEFVEQRYDIENGITLCKGCHKEFHSKYGIKHNTVSQFIEFKSNR